MFSFRDNANISELKSMVSSHLNCDLFNKDLLNIKTVKKELCNVYYSLGDFDCVEIYYDNKCITGYFSGNLEFNEVMTDENILKLPKFYLPRDCDDKEFHEIVEELYPDLSYQDVYYNCFNNFKEND